VDRVSIERMCAGKEFQDATYVAGNRYQVKHSRHPIFQREHEELSPSLTLSFSWCSNFSGILKRFVDTSRRHAKSPTSQLDDNDGHLAE